MERIRIALSQRHSADGNPLCIEAPNIRTALALAESEAAGGSAELWQGERRIGRLNRHGCERGGFWEIGSR